MSDYLNNLVARTFGLAPVVQPRLASLFESASVASNIQTEASLESETVNEAAMPPPQATTSFLKTTIAETRNPHEGAGPRNIEAAPKDSQSSTRKAPKPLVFQNASQLPAAPQRPVRIPDRTFPPELDGPHTPPNSDQPVASARAETLTPNVASTKEASDTDSWPRIESRVKNLVDAQLTNVKRPATDRERADRLAAIQPALPPPIRITRPVEPIAARAQQFDTKVPLPPAPPETISVTIGRVDVRAVFAQQPATRPAHSPTPPANSLDDYLKQRSEGRK